MGLFEVPAVPVLNAGYVKLVGLTVDLGDLNGLDSLDGLTVDAQVARAARVSYQAGTKSVRSDARLIDYLVRHDHGSPLEMPHFKFEIRAPLFVRDQWVRHRMGNFNIESLRYSKASLDFYVPDEWRAQDAVNKQSSVSGQFDADSNAKLSAIYTDQMLVAVQTYERLLHEGVAREMARVVLPSGMYVGFVWQSDLRNLLNFLRLRIASNAQWEIQEYARVVLELVERFAPDTVASWRRHVLGEEA